MLEEFDRHNEHHYYSKDHDDYHLCGQVKDIYVYDSYMEWCANGEGEYDEDVANYLHSIQDQARENGDLE